MRAYINGKNKSLKGRVLLVNGGEVCRKGVFPTVPGTHVLGGGVVLQNQPGFELQHFLAV